MKKIASLLLILTMLLATTACGSKEATDAPEGGDNATADGAQTLTGTGKGFGGDITATVTVEGDKITAVTVVGDGETKDIGTNAIDELPGKIVEAGNTNVDVTAGATVTSEGIIYAVNNAMDPASYPYPAEGDDTEKEPADVVETSASGLYQGLGINNSGRKGPGEDAEGVSVYSSNQVFANVLFDEEGVIQGIFIDQLEVVTPNYDGEGAPIFSGWPGQGGYNYDENHDGTIVGKTDDTEENFQEEVSSWITKRDRGDGYQMGTGSWSDQMDKYQELFVGKTVAEIEEWFDKYCSDTNGRPLQETSEAEGDADKYAALSDEDKTMLADVVTGATMSLNDAHGDIISAIADAEANKRPIEVDGVAGLGIGVDTSGRIRKSDDGPTSYSVNEIISATAYDADGKIVAIYVDQIEYMSPDSSNESDFAGFPGQTGLEADSDKDGELDGPLEPTEDTFLDDVSTWTTKRSRGDDYQMTSGSWEEQMDIFEKAFIGMTVSELEDWFAKYTSDENGKVLNDASEGEGDADKYAALSDEDKTMLTDTVAGATMSLDDAHGNIVGAIVKSYDNKVTVAITVEK